MKVSKINIVAVLYLVLFPSVFLYSEGTKQVMPNPGAKGQLCINKWRNDFAFYNAPPEFRLSISIAEVSETIRFGFGKVLSNSNAVLSDLVYRIKDPAGNIVYGPFPVPASGVGHISTYTEAITGPFAGGYNYLEIQPLLTGDYYLEFNYPNFNNDDTRHFLEFFDITVVKAAGTAVDGRVWSKAWQFWTESDPFYGKMMILSDDSIVTQVDCNGFKGGSFSFSSNSTGCSTTGNLSNDRMSRLGFHTYPQYKVFLNDPDSILFPTQKVSAGIFLPVTVSPDCTTGGADFGIKVGKDGSVKLFVEINPSPGVDPEDVQIIANVKTDPGGSGYNIIHWDGKDKLGRPVKNGTSLSFTVTNLSGLTNLPIYDIENNDKGFIVKQIRPKGKQLKIYWDDTSIPGGNSDISTGCLSPSGCHTWPNGFGNTKTINSWWFVTWTETSAVTFITKKSPDSLSISGNAMHCRGKGNLDFSVAADPNSTSYTWSYSGAGVTVDASGTTAKLDFSEGAAPGTVSVYGHNDVCGNGPVTNLDIMFMSLPEVSLTPFPDICYTLPGFGLTGGKPEGGSYFVDGTFADTLYPYKEAEGLHTIVYSYTAPEGCSNSDTATILLRNGPDCEGTVFFPDAFTPNKDNLNEKFKPVVENIYNFRMLVFNRWGEMIFSTDDATKGWDGTSKGEECPEGMYTFTATYAPSFRSNENKTQRGVFLLIR
ncbi:MAG: gliding motility-associated C-terminal domain-containing protein [Lentimicrobiaceae bacterium]|jgi:gliding motility-associated-like protein